MFPHETPNTSRYSPGRPGLHRHRHPPRPGSNPRKPSGFVARLSDRGAGGRALLAAGRQVGAGITPDHSGSHARRLSQAGNPARPAAAVAGPQLALEADGASRAGPATAPSTPPSANTSTIPPTKAEAGGERGWTTFPAPRVEQSAPAPSGATASPSFWPTLTGGCPPSTPRRKICPTRWSSPDPATAAGPGKPALP